MLNVFTKEEELVLNVAFGRTGKVFSNRSDKLITPCYFKSVVDFNRGEVKVQNYEKAWR
jgi:hypothetical protein